jgi:cytoskeleton protein RodZ
VFPGTGELRVTPFGAQLKKEREKQGITLEDIALSTKIGTRMLRALEEEHFDQLPGGIFNKGFIRAYARCLHMDEEQAIADYLAATGVTPLTFEESEKAPILEPPPQQNAGGSGLPWGIFAVVLLIVALGFAVWGFYFRESEKATQDTAAPKVNQPSNSQAATAEQSAPESKPAESTNSSAVSPKPSQQAAPTTAGEPAPSQAVTAPPPASALPPPPVVPTKETFLLVIKAREDSWLSIFVDGEIVTRALLTAPAQKSVRAQKEIVVKAGNVGALDFEFNGRKLPTQGDYGEVKTLTFDAHGLQAPTPKPEAPAQ